MKMLSSFQALSGELGASRFKNRRIRSSYKNLTFRNRKNFLALKCHKSNLKESSKNLLRPLTNKPMWKILNMQGSESFSFKILTRISRVFKLIINLRVSNFVIKTP